MKADKTDYYAYNKKLQPFANKLRKEMTKAEACLWKYALRTHKMKGYQFRRQRAVLQYIADFMCKELKLVIEVDGSTHQYEEISEKDKQKTNDLERAGFKVIRITDEEVLKNMNGVMQAIGFVVEEREKTHPLHPRQRGTTTPASCALDRRPQRRKRGTGGCCTPQ
jgi:very-short-patch-repair endonuclease